MYKRTKKEYGFNYLKRSQTKEVESNINIYSFQNQIQVNLDANESGTIAVFDLSGKEILSQPINTNQTSIELNTAQGIYLVRVETESETITRKVSIK